MEEYKELINVINKELKEIGSKGLTSSNIESASKLVDILKDLGEVEEGKMKRHEGGEYGMMPYLPPHYMGQDSYERQGYGMRGYGERGYNERGYNERGYNERGGYRGEYIDDYSARGGRSYNGHDTRMKERINRVIDGAEMYDYGRERYQHGGSHEAMEEGLEKMMYAICMLVETLMDAAQSPKEKEIVRKHIKKMYDA